MNKVANVPPWPSPPAPPPSPLPLSTASFPQGYIDFIVHLFVQILSDIDREEEEELLDLNSTEDLSDLMADIPESTAKPSDPSSAEDSNNNAGGGGGAFVTEMDGANKHNQTDEVGNRREENHNENMTDNGEKKEEIGGGDSGAVGQGDVTAAGLCLIFISCGLIFLFLFYFYHSLLKILCHL